MLGSSPNDLHAGSDLRSDPENDDQVNNDFHPINAGAEKSHRAIPSNAAFRTAIVVLFFVAAVLYFLQVFTPLRLTTDSLYYISVADSAAAGHKFTPGAQPIGYSIFLFLLIKAGIFSSATMILANCLFFAMGLFLTFRTLWPLRRGPRLSDFVQELTRRSQAKGTVEGCGAYRALIRISGSLHFQSTPYQPLQRAFSVPFECQCCEPVQARRNSIA